MISQFFSALQDSLVICVWQRFQTGCRGTLGSRKEVLGVPKFNEILAYFLSRDATKQNSGKHTIIAMDPKNELAHNHKESILVLKFLR